MWLSAVADHTMTKLDDKIAQYREELKRHPPGDPGRGTALFNLAVSLKDRFKRTDAIQDIEEAIGLHRTALALRPEGHPDPHKSLFELARCLVERYHKQGTLPDLEEAITLGGAALDLRPEGHTDRSYSLHNLSEGVQQDCIPLFSPHAHDDPTSSQNREQYTGILQIRRCTHSLTYPDAPNRVDFGFLWVNW